jgi:uncharacterized protein
MKPRVFLTAEWKHLAMLNYEVEPALLDPFVPAGTELDDWGGRALVSIVGFLFLKTRVLGLPIPFHQNFEEVNLRLYVRRKAEGEWRRGVVFIKEIVPRRAVAAVARIVYNENYAAMPMRHGIRMDGETLARASAVEYGWRNAGRWNSLSAQIAGQAEPLARGSEEEFITEHYWGYAAQAGGGAMEYQVEHPPWRVWKTSASALDCDVEAIYGRRFSEALRAAPRSAFVAEGSEIVVRKGVRV